jgi:hypothetical protein
LGVHPGSRLALDYDEGERLAKLKEEYGAFHEATMKA